MAQYKHLTPVQEAFAQILASGRKGGYREMQEAEEKAGHPVSKKECAAVKACRYAKSPRIILRVQELTEDITPPDDISQDDVITMLHVAYQKAKTVGHPSAMVQAAIGIAKVKGYMAPEKVQFVDPAEAVEKGRKRAEAALKKAPVVQLIQPQK